MSWEKMVFVGVIAFPRSLDTLLITYGYLAVENGKVSKRGTLHEFSEMEKVNAWSDFNVIRLTDSQFIMPGLVDCHTHAPQFPNIGLGLDRPLLDWLERYTFPLEKRYVDAQFAASVYENVVRRLLDCGTTTACYFASIHLEGTMELVKSVIKHGQRALVGKVSMNVRNNAGYYNETEKEIADVEYFIKRVLSFKHDLIAPIVTPRFALSCDEQLMTCLAKIAEKYGCLVQTHISENLREVEQVLRNNPKCSSYAEVYDKCKLLNHKCILAHGVYLTDDEITLLMSRKVSVAHCPASNTRLKSGLCPVRKLLDHAITVGLGTDVSGGDNATVLDAMRRAMDVSTHLEFAQGIGPSIGWKEAVCLATLGGAKALNLEDKIGTFDVGKEFDALLIDVYAANGPIDRYNHAAEKGKDAAATALVKRFVYLGDDRNIAQVYVKGIKVKDTMI
ncbi:guanine deaminase [Pectinophora gossypiella]|uniref:guanine deaminase n=1 Tax=Pectinophora gossypiella TaxID=13191 RepID=UPI00214E440D|nr:guanine deaminase [Pectinophora gossypiella]